MELLRLEQKKVNHYISFVTILLTDFQLRVILMYLKRDKLVKR